MIKQKEFYQYLFHCLDKPRFFMGLFLSFISAGMGLLIPQFIGKMMDMSFLTFILSNPLMLIGMLLFFLSVYTLQAISSYLLGMSGNQAMKKMQESLHRKILSLSITDVERYQAGDLSNRLTNDMSVVLKLISVTFPQVIMNLFIIVGTAYFLVSINFYLTLVSLVLILCLLFVTLPINAKLEMCFLDHQNLLGKLAGDLGHKFSKFRLIKSMNGEKQEIKIMSKVFSELFKNFRKILAISSFQSALLNSVIMFFILIIILIAGWQVQKGVMTIVTLTTFIIYVMQLLEPTSELIQSLDDFAEVKGVGTRVVELFNLASEDNNFSYTEVNDFSISFDAVSFSYSEQEKRVIDNLSFHISSGQHVAIIGPSGSGKTTLFSLLMKFYQYDAGEILIGGKRLRDLSSENVRDLISYTSQDNTLFHGTLRENLSYGKNSKVSDERMYFVLKELDLLSLMNQLPKGLESHISDSGQGLSEGQKQRFNIARSLMLPSDIYLFDEITASLDVETERIITKAVNSLTEGKTRLTIAHRLSTIREADIVFVFDDNGRIVDKGKHEELQLRNTSYQSYLQELN